METSFLDKKKESTPEEFAEYVRQGGDVYYWELGGFWVVTNHTIARNALKDTALSCDRSSFFISRMPNLDLNLIPDFFGVVKKMMVMSDGEEHRKRRGVALRPFSEEILPHYYDIVKKVIHDLIDKVSSRETFDFAREIAKPLPSLILAELFGIPESDRENFYKWSLNMTQFFGGASAYRNEDGIEVNQSASQIRDYFRLLIESRIASPKEDFLSMMIEQNRGLGLTNPELIAQTVMMTVAGQVTTTDQLNNNFFTLFSRPDLIAQLKADPKLVPSAMEESNRWDPGVTFLFRVASQSTRLGEVSIEPGAVVFISTHAVNRDPAVFEQPQQLKLDRNPNPHMVYGFGNHYCLGAPLARMQMNLLFSTILARFSRLTLGNWERDHYSLAFSGFKSLCVKIELS